MSDKRKYELKRRGAQMADTRRRIIEATVELHRTVGPVSTRINEIARRAGVRRVTVYSHFPDEAALLGACSAHWRSLHPVPDLEAWSAEADRHRRLRRGLAELYGWYRETEPMTANVLRDMEILPALKTIIEGGLGRYLGGVRQALLATVHPDEGRVTQAAAAVDLAVRFTSWQALSALGDIEAAAMMADLIEGAAADPVA